MKPATGPSPAQVEANQHGHPARCEAALRHLPPRYDFLRADARRASLPSLRITQQMLAIPRPPLIEEKNPI